MVTSRDPVMHRLVEVDPAPAGFELPPLSDEALFESILERARSERLWSRPVPVRQWRPGFVVAAAAFVAVLVVGGVISLLVGMLGGNEVPVVTEPPVVTTVAPVPTTVPPTVTTAAPAPTTVPEYEVTISVLDDGLFSASGSAADAGVVCDEGTIATITISGGMSTSGGDDYYATEEHTLTCTDGSGTIAVGMNVYRSWLMADPLFAGHWVVVGGSGDYERLAGGGDEVDGSCNSDSVNCNYEYAGRLDFSRDLATGPTVTAPTGRYDIEITYEGLFTADPFIATGAAVDAGLFCSDGLLSRICREVEVGTSVIACEDTFFCTDGTGWMTLGADMRRSKVSAPMIDTVYNGPWAVIGGSGACESATGSGRLSGTDEYDGTHAEWVYSGYLEISG